MRPPVTGMHRAQFVTAIARAIQSGREKIARGGRPEYRITEDEANVRAEQVARAVSQLFEPTEKETSHGRSVT